MGEEGRKKGWGLRGDEEASPRLHLTARSTAGPAGGKGRREEIKRQECPVSFPPNSSLAPCFNHTRLTVGPAPSGCPSKLLEASPPPFYNLPPPSAYTEAATRLFASPTPPSFFLRPGASSPLGWYKIFFPSSSLHPRILLRDGSSRGSRAVGGFESGGRIRRVFFFFSLSLFFFFFFFGGASGLFGVFALQRLGGEWNAQAPSVGREPAPGSRWEGASSSGRESPLQRLAPCPPTQRPPPNLQPIGADCLPGSASPTPPPNEAPAGARRRVG